MPMVLRGLNILLLNQYFPFPADLVDEGEPGLFFEVQKCTPIV
jgi:hypothetical protein